MKGKMKEIYVKNASIFAKIRGRKIDVEIRTGKDAQGIALFIDDKKILDLDYKDGKFVDGGFYTQDKAVFELGKGESI